MKLVESIYRSFDAINDEAWNYVVREVDPKVRSETSVIHRQLFYRTTLRPVHIQIEEALDLFIEIEL